MSDRVVFTLATIPMLSGALLLVALQRVPPLRVAAAGARVGAAQDASRSSAETAWLGVVTAEHMAELASELGGRVT